MHSVVPISACDNAGSSCNLTVVTESCNNLTGMNASIGIEYV
jgi:hypothetical protein